MNAGRNSRFASALAAVVLCGGFSSQADAADKIKVNRAATYASSDVGTPLVRSDCKFQDRIVEFLLEYGKGDYEVTDRDLSTESGRTLSIVITNVHAIGGGGFSGPKWGGIHVTLKEGGRSLYEFDLLSRSATGGGSACGVLKRISKQLGAKTAKRIKVGVAKLAAGEALPQESDDKEAEEEGAEAESR